MLLGNLIAKTELQKRDARRSNGVKSRWSVDETKVLKVVKVRDYLAPVKSSYRPCKLRGASGTRLSDVKRAMVARRNSARAEFFAELGVMV